MSLVRQTRADVELVDGDLQIAIARPAQIEVDVPELPTPAEAEPAGGDVLGVAEALWIEPRRAANAA